MRFLKDSILVYKNHLTGDLVHYTYWDVDYMGTGRTEKITEGIMIGKGQFFPLLKPLLVIRPPNTMGYTKRELGNLISDEITAHRHFLNRMSGKLELQLKTILETGQPYFVGTTVPDSEYVWVKLPKKWRFLEKLLGKEGGENEDEQPP